MLIGLIPQELFVDRLVKNLCPVYNLSFDAARRHAWVSRLPKSNILWFPAGSPCAKNL
jgi:hypothetical protein